jgi:hypothetical protein
LLGKEKVISKFLHIAIFVTTLMGFSASINAQNIVPTPTPSPSPIVENDEPIDPSAADDAVSPDGSDIYKWKLKRGAIEVGVDVGFAPMQPTFLSGHKEYDTTGRKFVSVNMHFGKVIGTVKGVTYEYLFDVSPMNFAIENEVVNPEYVSEKETPDTTPTVRETTYGFGFQPAKFRFTFMPKRRLKPYLEAGAGFLFTAKPIPVPQSPSYNFIGDFGGGLMYSIKPRQVVRFGYRYFHVSNMNIGEINPGYNASIFYVGYSWFSK